MFRLGGKIEVPLFSGSARPKEGALVMKIVWGFERAVRRLSTLDRVMVMPKLSPSMTEGLLVSLHKRVGDGCSSYDLFMEVTTKELTSTVSSNDPASHLLVEVMEDELFVAKIVAQVGATLPVGAPIAILTETGKEPDGQPSESLKAAAWQAYVTTTKDPGACGCS